MPCKCHSSANSIHLSPILINQWAAPNRVPSCIPTTSS
jgi:hypothetical protein